MYGRIGIRPCVALFGTEHSDASIDSYIRAMSITRIIGVLLLIGGVVLIIIGVTASHSLADNLSTLFRGRLTQNTLWYIIGGAVAAVVGLLLTIGVIGRTTRS